MVNTNLFNKLNAWNDTSARHLLSRVLYGFTETEVQFALTKTLDDFVDNYILSDTTVPLPPGDWVTEIPIPNNSTVDNQRTKEMSYWWMQLMLNQGPSLREKMVLFFHNHFVSEIAKVKYPQWMYQQNKLFRDYAFGNFKELTKKVTVDPAMLFYLDGVQNNKTKPNENYARELLELFTIGIGNYTETDIREAARALTGWQINGNSAVFTSSRFDNTNKTFFGQTGNWGYTDIVDIIFSKNQTAVYIAEKLCKEFIYYQPDVNYVNQLADLFRNSGYNLKTTISAMLKSEYFYSNEIKGSKIKSPVELLLGMIKSFNIDPVTVDFEYLRTTVNTIQQQLLDPPDVRGWIGQRNWINSLTLPSRNAYTDSVVNGKKSSGSTLSFKVNSITFARSFPTSENALLFIDDIIKHFYLFPVSQYKKDFLLQTMLSGTTIQNWSTYDPNAESRLKNFFKVLCRTAEFQLS